MSEQSDAVDDLERSGFLAGLRWAWQSARTQTLQSMDPDTGHDQGWVGYNAFKVLVDRLDRVFACGRFELKAGADPSEGADLLAAGIDARDLKRMPRIASGAVERANLNGSPGWRSTQWRILLQSFGGKELDRIPWPQASPTKRSVAAQPPPDQLLLPVDFDTPMAFEALAEEDDRKDASESVIRATLVAAYEINVVSGGNGCFLGRPRFNDGGGSSWHWRIRVSDEGSGRGGRDLATSPKPDGSTPFIEDAPVRLRPVPQEGSNDESAG